MTIVIIHDYNATSFNISHVTGGCEIVAIGTSTQITHGIEYYESVSAREIETVSFELEQMSFEFYDKFALVRKYFKGVFGWCFDQDRGFTYQILYYAIALLTTGMVINLNCDRPIQAESGYG